MLLQLVGLVLLSPRLWENRSACSLLSSSVCSYMLRINVVAMIQRWIVAQCGKDRNLIEVNVDFTFQTFGALNKADIAFLLFPASLFHFLLHLQPLWNLSSTSCTLFHSPVSFYVLQRTKTRPPGSTSAARHPLTLKPGKTVFHWAPP